MKTVKLTAVQKLIRLVDNDPKYSGIKWIVNVLVTGCGRPASRVKALVALVDAGHDIRPLDFIMPYEGIRVDGYAFVTMPLLDRNERIAYDRNWFTH